MSENGATATQPATAAEPSPANIRTVISASALGTVFEWYDFFVYGILAALIGQLFFPPGNPAAATLASLAIFGAGFGMRPVGALVFGYFGDRIGRKYTFLATITLMGGATALIGLLPTYATAGLLAPALLVVLRCLQGLALGGEYGGAAIYVAEHAPPGKRGQYTSWIQISVVGGFLLAVLVVLGCRTLMSAEAFTAWGWRLPFLLSLIMLAISIWIRLKLSESPVFKAMKEAGTTSKNYYTSQFGTLYFLQGTARIAETEALGYMAIGAFLAAPLYVGFGWVSDHIGRKKLLLAGYALAALLVFPLFHFMADGANPALARAQAASPVTVTIPQACEFSVFGRPDTPCEQALAYLTKRGISYERREVAGDEVSLAVGDARVDGFDEAAYLAAITAAGYPDVADPAEKQSWKIILAIAIMVALSAMTYGQVAAILVELFPARIRYTSMSVPYHIGTGYFGGFLPFISQYIVVSTGNAFSGLWYTVAVVVMAFIVTAIWLPETYKKELE